MFRNQNEVAVLQAIVDRISTVGQWARRTKVFEDVRGKRDEFAGDDGAKLFETTIASLYSECLIDVDIHKGEPHLTIRPDALKVDGLMTDCLLF